MSFINNTSENTLIDNLINLLSSEYVLYTKTLGFHWNVEGSHFVELHKLFNSQYTELLTFIDRIAEQIRKFGYKTPNSSREFLQFKLKEIQEVTSDETLKWFDMVNKLRIDHSILADYINNLDILNYDLATQNMLGDILDFHMKSNWFLSSLLQ